MKEQEFIEESVEYIKSKYKDFLEIRQVIKDIFNVFHTICINNSINYCLAYGSLIGYIRDGGIIPWDPDMDVFVPINEISKLMKCMDEQLPKDYFYKSNFNDDTFHFFEMKIGKKGFPLYRIHLDIFYLIGAPKDNKIKFQKKCINTFFRRKNYFLSKTNNPGMPSDMNFLKKAYYRVKSRAFSVKQINKKFTKLAFKHDMNEANEVMAFCETSEIYNKNDIFPIKKSDINGNVCIPNNIDSTLNVCYKNYKEYLPVSNRFNEFYEWMKMYEFEIGTQKNINYYN